MTMQLILTRDLTSDDVIEFASIPQTYTDLMILISSRTDRAAVNDAIIMKLNGTTSTGKRIYGTGSGRASTNNAEPLDAADSATATTFSNIQIYIPNYTRTNQYKAWSSDAIVENNATQAYQSFGIGVYSSNSAITTITLQPETGTNFKSNSTFSLYGITKGSDGTTTVS